MLQGTIEQDRGDKNLCERVRVDLTRRIIGGDLWKQFVSIKGTVNEDTHRDTRG